MSARWAPIASVLLLTVVLLDGLTTFSPGKVAQDWRPAPGARLDMPTKNASNDAPSSLDSPAGAAVNATRGPATSFHRCEPEKETTPCECDRLWPPRPCSRPAPCSAG